GHFAFSDLSPGEYIVDADLQSFACPQPEHLILSDNTDIGTLRLVQPQPLDDIQQDVTWISGNAYLLQDDILVHPQAALSIQDGVLILAQPDAALIVAGEIQILGDPNNPVRFRLTPEAYALGADWDGILLEQPVSICVLSGLSLQGASTALRVVNGQAQVSNALISSPSSFAAYFSAAAQGSVAHSIILEGNQGLVADNCSPAFEYNLMLRTTGAGITVKSYSGSIVHDNVLLDCYTGIWSDWETSPQIHDNLISGGFRGLDAQNGFTAIVEYNEFQNQSQECIYLHVKNCYPLIEWNNFINAPVVILHVNGNAGQQADTVFAPNNYWDGQDAASISDRILDGHDIGSPENPIGPVDYIPFSASPVPGAGP
ncbi:MAG TPA: right-handed parallel beta-helix repeat-containing protein, partial [bacterium]